MLNFLGEINRNKLEILIDMINSIINPGTDNICIFHLCEGDYNRYDFLGINLKKDFLEKYVIL